MSTLVRKSVFPRPARATSTPRPPRRARMKDPTRENITPATDLAIDPKSQQDAGIVAKNGTLPWPGNLNMVPNATIRSSLFGCARPRPSRRTLVYERLLATSGQYVVKYRGHELDQQDCEVWELALAWCRQSGKPIGARVHFAFNDWCRVLQRSLSDPKTNKAIVESLKRLMTGYFIITFPDGLERWIHPINDVGRDLNTGRAYLSFDREVHEWLTHDVTEIDLHRKVSLSSDLARWLHDYYSSSSTPFSMNVSTLMKLSGTPANTAPNYFRSRLVKAVDELKQCEPPLFAPDSRVEKRDNGEWALFVEKATNSRLVPPKRIHQMEPAATAASSQPVASVALPSPAAEPRPAAPKRAPKGAMSEHEADARAAYRKMLAERDRAEAALYVPKDGGRPLY